MSLEVHKITKKNIQTKLKEKSLNWVILKEARDNTGQLPKHNNGTDNWLLNKNNRGKEEVKKFL